ncbi:MAG: hypothetical protein DMG96_00565 [Acidobacteria bacterium]|nr:MAG: hypothetical protein DMG96_00565 [Acidobacteriota bacterium]
MSEVPVDWSMQQVVPTSANHTHTVFQASRRVEQMLQTTDVDEGSILVVFQLRNWLVHVIAEVRAVIKKIQGRCGMTPGKQELR